MKTPIDWEAVAKRRMMENAAAVNDNITPQVRRHVVFDCETTGFGFSSGDRIVEFSALELINGEQTGQFLNALVNPRRHIPDKVAQIHGICNETVHGCPDFAHYADALIDFIGSDVMVIHNAPFDIGFLNAELALAGKPAYSIGQTICTLKRARILWPKEKNNLADVAKRLGIKVDKAKLHSAYGDTLLLADVFKAIF
jgi:DNA polymerase-3 subunit epsilon